MRKTPPHHSSSTVAISKKVLNIPHDWGPAMETTVGNGLCSCKPGSLSQLSNSSARSLASLRYTKRLCSLRGAAPVVDVIDELEDRRRCVGVWPKPSWLLRRNNERSENMERLGETAFALGSTSGRGTVPGVGDGRGDIPPGRTRPRGDWIWWALRRPKYFLWCDTMLRRVSVAQ